MRKKYALNILFVNNTARFDAGGAERILYDILRVMSKGRHRLMLAVPREDDSNINEFKKYVREIHVLAKFDPGSRDMGRRFFHTALCLITLTLQVAWLLFAKQIDVLYANSIYALYFSALPAWVSKTPLIYHEHNLVSLRNKSIWSIFFAPLLRFVDKTVAITDAVRSELLQSGMDQSKIIVVHNWVSDAYEKNRSSSTLWPSPWMSDDHYLIGQIANLHRWKGHDTVVRALPCVLRHIPNLKFVVFGKLSDYEYLLQLTELAKDLGVEHYVEFAGFRHDMHDILPRLDCLVVASRKEPFGLVLVEAMLAGVPVVAANAGGVPEIIEDGVTGLLFPPDDTEALAERLKSIASDSELRNGLVREAKKSVLERFSMLNQVAKIANIIQEVGCLESERCA